MRQALPLLRFLRDRAGRGQRTVLVTLTDVTGSAARAPGEHMAVAEDGTAVGSFSGGCVEAAVIAEAQDVLVSGEARLVRFGAGSRYIDIRLPCGGGIDLLFTPQPDPDQIEPAITRLEGRRPTTLELSRDGGLATAEAGDRTGAGWAGATFCVRHDPLLRVTVLGHGAEPMALLDIADAYGAELQLLSPQASLVEEARARGFDADLLHVLGRSDRLVADPWTAVVTLFHDHDWETDLLLQTVEQRPLFVGAMGSRRTHAERRRRLLDAGGDPQAIDRIVGPIGLLPASRDPRTLAISIMAQVVQAYEAALASPAVARQRRDAATMRIAHRLNECCASVDREPKALQALSGAAADTSISRRRAG